MLTADAMGGTAFYAAGLSLIGDMPWRRHWPVKWHAWANAGRLSVLDRCASFSLTLSPSSLPYFFFFLFFC
jgi:outer membrane protein insertion porin family